MKLTYGSVCSGIEAASVAWEPLGFEPAWFAQFDPEHDYSRGPDYPSAVLAAHWPEVENFGDMIRLVGLVRFGDMAAPDIIVGGTPCQSFSIAGMRAGLTDLRGQLTLAYVELADAVDAVRAEEGKPPTIVIWENVPGVLSSKDNAFGCFLAALAGDVEPYPQPTKARGGGSVLVRQWCCVWTQKSNRVAGYRRPICRLGPTTPSCVRCRKCS